MLNQDIPEEFYARVEAVARQFQKGWSHLDWEDIRQEMWVFLLERRNQLKEATLDPTDTNLRVIAKQVVAELTEQDNVAWGKYEYGTKHVRSMLEAGLLHDDRMGTLSERHDLDNAMSDIAVEYPQHWDAITHRYYNDEPVVTDVERKRLQRAVDKLTELMNRYRLMQVIDHVGLNSDEPNPPFDVIEDMFGGDEELYYSNMH
jgi:hypothetical protein